MKPDHGKQPAAIAADPVDDKSEQARRAILDATVDCYVEYGWNGANMSVIARRAHMTRGRIQYYFPTLQDLQRASIDYLLGEWRGRYIAYVEGISGATERFDAGINGLWLLMRHPLHIAKQELEAQARTNPDLRRLLTQAMARHEEESVQAVMRVYPDLAARGEAELRLAREFTNVFMEGLSLYRFAPDAAARHSELIDLLKTLLISYWSGLGAEGLPPTPGAGKAPRRSRRPAAEPRRERALALIKEAAALLSDG